MHVQVDLPVREYTAHLFCAFIFNISQYSDSKKKTLLFDQIGCGEANKRPTEKQMCINTVDI